jgi:hypothetical protein
LGDDKLGSREARKESRSLGIFKGVSKSSESPTTSPPPPSTIIPEETSKHSKTTFLPSIDPSSKPEKTTKTTATYYPKLSRQESIIVRKDSIAVPTITTTTPSAEQQQKQEQIHSPLARKETITPSSALASLGKSGYESESGDEFGPTEWNSAQSVALKPYSHQVGGHSALFKFSRHAVCKPLVEKENAFYQEVEINRPECTHPNPSLPPLFGDIFSYLCMYSITVHAEVYWNFECHTSGLRVEWRINSSESFSISSKRRKCKQRCSISNACSILFKSSRKSNHSPSRSPNRQKSPCKITPHF